MIKYLLAAILACSPSQGVWVTKSGDEVIEPCPTKFENSRMKMPRGCVAQAPGVLLTRDYFMALELDKVRNEEKIKQLEEERSMLEHRLSNVELGLSLCVGQPEKECPSTVSPLISVPLGVGLGFAACKFGGN